MNELYNSGIIFVHFPENGHHGCGKHCSFCLFDQLDYNIPIKPTDEEVITFCSQVRDDKVIQICGAGDPLFNFEKNKDYVCHLINLIHQCGHPVQLVTKYQEVVEEYIETDLKTVELFIFSIEMISEKLRQLIDKVTSLNKIVRITKVANFTEDIKDLNWNLLEHYAAFYSNIKNKENLSICFRPNYNFTYSDEDVWDVREKIDKWAEKYGCRVYMHAASVHIKTPQLWNGRHIPCSDTNDYIKKDMGYDN